MNIQLNIDVPTLNLLLDALHDKRVALNTRIKDVTLEFGALIQPHERHDGNEIWVRFCGLLTSLRADEARVAAQYRALQGRLPK